MIRVLYILGIIIGLYAIFNNLPYIFNVNFLDPGLAIAKILVSLFPVIAGGVIVYVSGYNLYLSFKKKDESKEE
ncbi:hypothetical protein [Sulfurihydrogenibium sp.]|jgi:uncharacterized membrane protein|uniref:hypothetical protein n=1 Tax=Sulfurihydrogenibium sp. TaxID=2053621 RepID=UPI0026095161|nr:hypothetical protein [Sulfurihydrogenibium sp.]